MAKIDKIRVLLDSSALLSIIKDEPGSDRLCGLLDMIAKGKAQLVESVLVLGEVYKKSNAADSSERQRQDEKLDNIRSLLVSRDVLLLDVTPPIVYKATEFREKSKPKQLPDAIHLATAVLNRCDWFVTFDTDFPDIEGLKTIRRKHLQNPQAVLPWEEASEETLFLVPIDHGE